MRSLSVLAIAIAAVGCGQMASLNDGAVAGPCTVALIVDGEQLMPPYQVPMSMLGGGLSEQVINYDGEGWRGTVSMTAVLPGGRLDEGRVEARTLNAGLMASILQQAGTFHVAFQDSHGCRQEIDVEVVVED